MYYFEITTNLNIYIYIYIYSSISSRTGCPLGIVNNEDHKVESFGATIPMCLHGTKSKIFKNNILSMTDASLNDHACFNYYSNASCLYRKREGQPPLNRQNFRVNSNIE